MKKRRSATKKPMFPTRVRSMSLCLSLSPAPKGGLQPFGPLCAPLGPGGPREGAPPASGPLSCRKNSAAMGGPSHGGGVFTLFCGGFTFFNVKPPIYKPIYKPI